MSVVLAAKLKKANTLLHVIVLCPGGKKKCHLECNDTSLGSVFHSNPHCGRIAITHTHTQNITTIVFPAQKSVSNDNEDY